MTPCTFCPANKGRIRKCLCPPEKRKPLCPSCAESHGCDITHVNVKEWKKANAPEERLTTQIIEALNLLPGIRVERVDAGGANRSRNSVLRPDPGAADVQGCTAPDGRALYIETKNIHLDGCPCDSCGAQRLWGAARRAQGAVYVANVRSVRAAIDGVRSGLAIARAKTGEAA